MSKCLVLNQTVLTTCPQCSLHHRLQWTWYKHYMFILLCQFLQKKPWVSLHRSWLVAQHGLVSDYASVYRVFVMILYAYPGFYSGGGSRCGGLARGRKSPSGVQGQNPGRGPGGRILPEAEAKCEISVQFLTFSCINFGFNEHKSRAWRVYLANIQYKIFWKFNGWGLNPPLGTKLVVVVSSCSNERELERWRQQSR